MRRAGHEFGERGGWRGWVWEERRMAAEMRVWEETRMVADRGFWDSKENIGLGGEETALVGQGGFR